MEKHIFHVLRVAEVVSIAPWIILIFQSGQKSEVEEPVYAPFELNLEPRMRVIDSKLGFKVVPLGKDGLL